MPINVETRVDRVTVVTIDNCGKMNALDRSMVETLAALWPRLAEDVSTRVVLLRGANGTFCAGADLTADLHEIPGFEDQVAAALLKLGRFPKPIVAAVQGACVAGGLELVLAADVRITSMDARLGFPEVRWGIFPGGGAALKLTDQIGYANAMSLLLTGQLISGARAGEIGLFSHVVPVERVESLAEELAAAIAANSPLAVQSVKRYVTEGRGRAYEQRSYEERTLVDALHRSGQRSIGTKAFLSRAVPVYEDGEP